MGSPPSLTSAARPAGCLVRILAFGIDVVVLLGVLAVMNLLLEAAFSHHLSRIVLDVEGRRFSTLQARYELLAWFLSPGVILLYFTLSERSPWRGSIGKILVGCRIVRSDGRVAGLFRLAWRNLLKALSIAFCFLGVLVAVFSPNRRTLHDFLSGCRVVKKS